MFHVKHFKNNLKHIYKTGNLIYNKNMKGSDNMDVTEITQLISSVGFPIVACMAMFYMNNKTLTELKDTIQNNTTVMELILQKIGVDVNVKDKSDK